MIKILKRILTLASDDVKGPESMGLKLMEEVGEYAETINFAMGYLPHKQLKESPFGEAADVIQNTVAILRKLYPELSDGRILEILEEELIRKTDKWESIMVKKSVQV